MLIGAGVLLVAQLPARWQRVVARFGRSSSVVYVFHIPFCYGALGAWLRGRLGVAECLPFVVLLMAASYAALVTVERSRAAVALRFQSTSRLGLG